MRTYTIKYSGHCGFHSPSKKVELSLTFPEGVKLPMEIECQCDEHPGTIVRLPVIQSSEMIINLPKKDQ